MQFGQMKQQDINGGDSKAFTKGLMIILSSPSGAGKTTIARALLAADSNRKLSVSVTTRPIRAGEIDGKDYYFISKDKFTSLKKNNKLIEHAEVFGNYYGIPRELSESYVNSGVDVLYDINWEGAKKLMQNCSDYKIVSIFIMPPSLEVLESRLRNRATDSKEAIGHRLDGAKFEISKKGMYKYVVINHDINTALQEIESIINKEKYGA